MALRSLVGKLPALGARSWPTAPLTGPVHKLSPAAASRLMSTGLPSAEGREQVSSPSASERREKINQMRAEWDQSLKALQRDIAACNELRSPEPMDMDLPLKAYDEIRRACNAGLVVCASVTALTYVYSISR